MRRMSPADVLLLCRAAGLQVRPKGLNLFVTPKAKLTDELRALLRQHKDDLLALLRRSDRVDELQTICPGCGALFVDLCGRGTCLACTEPANRVVA